MSSHRQILKSTAIIGVAQIVNIAIGILRNKALAMLLGPAGVGLSGLYSSALNIVGSVSGLGINSSGVRHIASANSVRDELATSRMTVSLRRVSFITGAIGMLLVIALAPLMSWVTFGDKTHVAGISILSVTLLFSNISAGQGALLQGLRRLRDLAAAQILGGVLGGTIGVLVLWWLRIDGIVPFLAVGSLCTVLVTWRYARAVPIVEMPVTWGETARDARGLLALGLAFTTSGLVSVGSAYITRVLVQRELGLEAVGIYTAGWTLSSVYVGFVLAAMGADFMPRLTSVAEDHPEVNRLVNEQTESGVLMALPGVAATIALAPLVMRVMYSEAFVTGAPLMRWQIIGVFLRVVSWPIGYIIIAKGNSMLLAAVEIIGGAFGILSLVICMNLWHLEGVGIAAAISYVFSTCLLGAAGWRLTEFRWNRSTRRLLVSAAITVLVTLFVVSSLLQPWNAVVGCLIAVAAGVCCMLALQRILGVSVAGIVKQNTTKLWASVRRVK